MCLIPRVIHLDPIQDFILREEGFSGASHSQTKPLAQLVSTESDPLEILDRVHKSDAEYQMQLGGALSKSEGQLADTQGAARTVVLTENGIEILNYSIANAIKPLQKPRIRSPLDRPVHEALIHRNKRHVYSPTKRFGSAVNSRVSVDNDEADRIHLECMLMSERQKFEFNKSKLVYTSMNVASSNPQLQILHRGCSYRGRGVLDLAMGWVNLADLDEETMGDISSSITSQPNYEQRHSLRNKSIPDVLGVKKKPQKKNIEETTNRSSDGVIMEELDVIDNYYTEEEERISIIFEPSPKTRSFSKKAAQYSTAHAHFGISVENSVSILEVPLHEDPENSLDIGKCVNDESLSFALETIESFEPQTPEFDDDAEWMAEQKKALFGGWRNDEATAEAVAQCSEKEHVSCLSNIDPIVLEHVNYIPDFSPIKEDQPLSRLEMLMIASNQVSSEEAVADISQDLKDRITEKLDIVVENLESTDLTFLKNIVITTPIKENAPLVPIETKIDLIELESQKGKEVEIKKDLNPLETETVKGKETDGKRKKADKPRKKFLFDSLVHEASSVLITKEVAIETEKKHRSNVISKIAKSIESLKNHEKKKENNDIDGHLSSQHDLVPIESDSLEYLDEKRKSHASRISLNFLVKRSSQVLIKSNGSINNVDLHEEPMRPSTTSVTGKSKDAKFGSGILKSLKGSLIGSKNRVDSNEKFDDREKEPSIYSNLKFGANLRKHINAMDANALEILQPKLNLEELKMEEDEIINAKLTNESKNAVDSAKSSFGAVDTLHFEPFGIDIVKNVESMEFCAENEIRSQVVLNQTPEIVNITKSTKVCSSSVATIFVEASGNVPVRFVQTEEEKHLQPESRDPFGNSRKMLTSFEKPLKQRKGSSDILQRDNLGLSEQKALVSSLQPDEEPEIEKPKTIAERRRELEATLSTEKNQNDSVQAKQVNAMTSEFSDKKNSVVTNTKTMALDIARGEMLSDNQKIPIVKNDAKNDNVVNTNPISEIKKPAQYGVSSTLDSPKDLHATNYPIVSKLELKPLESVDKYDKEKHSMVSANSQMDSIALKVEDLRKASTSKIPSSETRSSIAIYSKNELKLEADDVCSKKNIIEAKTFDSPLDTEKVVGAENKSANVGNLAFLVAEKTLNPEFLNDASLVVEKVTETVLLPSLPIKMASTEILDVKPINECISKILSEKPNSLERGSKVVSTSHNSLAKSNMGSQTLAKGDTALKKLTDSWSDNPELYVQ